MQIKYLSTSNWQLSAHAPLQSRDAIVVMPFIRPAQAETALRLMAERAQVPGVLLGIHDDAGWGFIKIINQAFRVTQSPYFGYVAQDAFAGRSWLALALDAMGDRGVLLGCNDGKWAGALAAFGLAQRQWAQGNYQGDFFYPHYQRHFADAELTLLAMQAGRYVYEPNSVLVEIDWQKDHAAVDAADRRLFRRRQATGFDERVIHPQLRTLFS